VIISCQFQSKENRACKKTAQSWLAGNDDAWQNYVIKKPNIDEKSGKVI